MVAVNPVDVVGLLTITLSFAPSPGHGIAPAWDVARARIAIASNAARRKWARRRKTPSHALPRFAGEGKSGPGTFGRIRLDPPFSKGEANHEHIMVVLLLAW
jgi:hypothetical protein